MSAARRPLVIAARAIGLLTIFVIATLGAARLHLEQSLGRRALGDAIEGLVSSEVRGTLRIGRVDEAGIDRVLAREVEIRDEDGAVVLRIERADLDPDLGALLRERTIGTSSGRLRGATLRMIQGEQGLTIERALESPSPPPSAARERGGSPSFFIDFAGLSFEGLDTVWRLDGAPAFRIDDVSGFARIRTDERGNVAMRFDRLEGDLRTTDLPIDVSAGVREASGRVRAGWDRMASFDIELDVAGSPLRLDLDLYDREGGLRVAARMHADAPSIAWLAALGVDVGTDLAGAPGEIELEGGLGAK